MEMCVIVRSYFDWMDECVCTDTIAVVRTEDEARQVVDSLNSKTGQYYSASVAADEDYILEHLGGESYAQRDISYEYNKVPMWGNSVMKVTPRKKTA